MSYGSDFVLTIFTNDPALAARADTAGIDRIGIDLDHTGKHERQSAKSWISTHRADDLAGIRASVRKAKVFARVDSVAEGMKEQVDYLIAAGAQALMLPYFSRVEEASRFIEAVNGRAEVSLLVETGAAAARIHELTRLGGVDEIFVGLNDLHLELKLKSHFEVLASPLLEMLSETVRAAEIRFGFGGIGRVGDASLPISSGLVYPQYPRLGATSALVSRVFLLPDSARVDLAAEVALARKTLDDWNAAARGRQEAARDALREKLREC